MLGGPVQPHPLSLLEADEEQAHLWVHAYVPRAQVHAVAVVVRERDRALVEHAHEARLTALVRALRLTLGIGGGDEEHVGVLHEDAVALVDRRAGEEALLDPLGETLRVEALLEVPVSLVI